MPKKKPSGKKTTKDIQIEFLSGDKLSEYTSPDKLELIFSKVKANTLLVLEEALDPQEKKELIMRSMESIDENFSGVEFSSLEEKSDLWTSIMKGLHSAIGREYRSGLTVIGNASSIASIKEDRNSIRLMLRGR